MNESSRLISFNKQSNKNSVSHLNDSDAGLIPSDWEIGRVKDFFTLGRGRVISKSYIRENSGPFPVFSSQSLNNGEMGKIDTYDFDGSYLTWTTDGAYAGSVFFREGKFNCTNVCGTCLAKDPSVVNTKYAAYYLETKAKKYVSYVGNPKLMNNIFAEIPIVLPPLSEQRKITKIISAIDKYISLLNLKIEKLNFLFNAQRQKFFEEKSSWNEYKISDIADPLEKYSLTGGPFGSDLKTSDYLESGIRIIQLQNIEDSNFNNKNKIYTSLEKANNLISSNIFAGDLIIAKMGDPVAKCTIIPNNLSRCLMSSDGIRLKVNEEIFDKFFIELSINSPYFRKKTTEISTGTTRQRIGLQEFRNLTIFCPTINDQIKISKILRSIRNTIKHLTHEKYILTNFKTGLSSDLLSGAKRVNL